MCVWGGGGQQHRWGWDVRIWVCVTFVHWVQLNRCLDAAMRMCLGRVGRVFRFLLLLGGPCTNEHRSRGATPGESPCYTLGLITQRYLDTICRYMATTPDDSSTHLLHGVTCEDAKHHGDTCMGQVAATVAAQFTTCTKQLHFAGAPLGCRQARLQLLTSSAEWMHRAVAPAAGDTYFGAEPGLNLSSGWSLAVTPTQLVSGSHPQAVLCLASSCAQGMLTCVHACIEHP